MKPLSILHAVYCAAIAALAYGKVFHYTCDITRNTNIALSSIANTHGKLRTRAPLNKAHAISQSSRLLRQVLTRHSALTCYLEFSKVYSIPDDRIKGLSPALLEIYPHAEIENEEAFDNRPLLLLTEISTVEYLI